MSDWPCEAYGPDGLEHGARCFLAGKLGERLCGTSIACGYIMAAERRRVFRRIQQLAAAGDPLGMELAAAFTDPDQLLGGEA